MEIESIIEKKCIQLLHKAIAFKASDIHIVPEYDKYEIYFRKFGRLVPIEQYPKQIASRLITYMKFLADLDIAEKRKPQSGSFQRDINNALYSFLNLSNTSMLIATDYLLSFIDLPSTI